MDVSHLKKDLVRALSALTTLADGSVIANKPLKICFPKRFEENGFAVVGEDVSCVAMVGLIVDDCYASIAALTRFNFEPVDIEETVINGDRYVVMGFEAGEKVIDRLQAAVENMMGYQYYMEFCKYCNIPWYLDFEVILSVLDEAGFYTGKAISEANQTLRVLYSMTCREPGNTDVAFRYSPLLSNLNVQPEVIGVNNPGQLLTGVFSRFSGGYIGENTSAALLEGDTQISEIEKVYKGILDE